MTANASLIAHCGAQHMNRAQLAELPQPEKLGRFHQPTRHIEVVDTLDRIMNDRGLEIIDEQFAAYRDNSMLFGIMKLRADEATGIALPFDSDDGTFALGLRTSTNKTMAIQIAVGLNIFVCDNLCFSGDEVALRRKNTSGLDLPAEIGAGVDRFIDRQGVMARNVEWAQNERLPDNVAKEIIYDQFAQGLMAGSHFPDVHRNYFEATPEMTDCLPRSRWGLHNAFTRELRTLKPRARYKATLALGAMIDPSRN